ncbi:MAG: DUF3883 domain-containing protein [Pseudomonadales bacterium]|nr:DUF3883 domain-containing protein [Nitrospira sp.]MCP5129195.1 DUF3883 domain-containing protein [Pseudomonadales bacterium]
MTEINQTRLEDLKAGASVQGLTPTGTAKVVNIEWYGDQAVKVIFEDAHGGVQNRLVYRDEEHTLKIASAGRSWSFDADGAMLRLVTEANRIKLAHHFDPYLAIHTSLVQPLPHQITAVYGEMLPRQPLRFLLADDPGAGKTIMAGLLIKELIARGDLERCLVVAPGSLVEQWQDELGDKFNLEFDILSRDMIENSRSGNPFNDRNHMIARLDVLARNEELQEKLIRSQEWDLIISDEAHRMSASYFGGDVKYTKRYQLGQKLGQICRHLLLMSATPHNGKEEDFQLFMALLDGDRFEGRFRDGVHYADTQDMMRRLTKEELLKFDGTRLFPERLAYTVKYELSNEEASLYWRVTDYVREEMNRVRRFAEEDAKKRNNVGFALQILQRRLASSPAAIYQSLKRRREKLENELAEARLIARGKKKALAHEDEYLSNEVLGNIDEYGEEDIEAFEETISTTATTAETIEQLQIEVETLKDLEQKALGVLRSGKDTKWLELNKILDDDLMIDSDGNRRKLIIFTEAKDTLQYLADKIRTRLGKPESVEVIHGGVTREERRKVISRFMQDRELQVLVANDAAGEGVNLQRGHLMVNYDLPWNPNKIEQRFGRIHRIGQTEVCHLWNLVAADTREGEVYARLLEKLETARAALGGRVYDVLGKEPFEGTSLKDLLWEAIQYGESDEAKAKLFEKIDGAVDYHHIEELLKKRKLTNDMMAESDVESIRLEMERAEAQRLQPHHIQSFFIEAFKHLGGRFKKREEGRFEITHVPVRIRERDRLIGRGAPVQKRFERICFDKQYINQQPVAEFVCPGHPLLEAVISLIRDQYGDLMKLGAVMVDESDPGEDIQAVFLMEHSIEDGRKTSSGANQIVSQRLQFASIREDGTVVNAGIAPHLNLRPATTEEVSAVEGELKGHWLSDDLESEVKKFAIIELAQEHLKEVKNRRLPEIEKTEREVQARLKKEINYWDGRAFELKEEANAGKKTRLNWENAQRRAEDLADRLKRRMEQLAQEKNITASAPVVRGGLIVVPQGLLAKKQPSGAPAEFAADAASRRQIEIMAMNAVMEAERSLGNKPEDVSAAKVGYDIVSLNPDTKKQRFIEVKGRIDGANTITVTRNEIITSLNKPEDYILAIVQISQESAQEPRYVWQPFEVEPAFGVTAQQFELKHLLSKSEVPR